jgi:hypothetical protein
MDDDERDDREPVGPGERRPPSPWDDAQVDLRPIDAAAPVSGHIPASELGASAALAVEHDWAAAASHVFPVLRPPGTHGTMLADIDEESLAAEGLKKHALPLIDPGPAGLAVAYALRAAAYDVLVNADHLLAWGITPEQLRQAAMDNLTAWSQSAPWSDEVQGGRRLLSSDTSEGGDAARILLPEVRAHLAGECGAARCLIGLPDRDLLLAGSLQPGDEEFAGQLAAFVADVAEGAHEPIAHGLFELVGDAHELVAFRG